MTNSLHILSDNQSLNQQCKARVSSESHDHCEIYYLYLMISALCPLFLHPLNFCCENVYVFLNLSHQLMPLLRHVVKQGLDWTGLDWTGLDWTGLGKHELSP